MKIVGIISSLLVLLLKQIWSAILQKSWVKSVLAMCFLIMLFAGNAIAENMEDGTKILLQQILLYVFSGALF